MEHECRMDTLYILESTTRPNLIWSRRTHHSKLGPTILNSHQKPHGPTLQPWASHIVRASSQALAKIHNFRDILCHRCRLAVVSSKGCCPVVCTLCCAEVNSSAAGEIESPSAGLCRKFIYCTDKAVSLVRFGRQHVPRYMVSNTFRKKHDHQSSKTKNTQQRCVDSIQVWSPLTSL